MRLDYLLLDVFTDRPLSGNPLAVVPHADGLLDNVMQAIAREFNLSETVFIQRPAGERNTASVRIFTPHEELPFAGHPTVGAAVVLALNSKASAVRIEEKVGLVTALVERRDRRSGEARFTLPRLPEKLADLTDRLAMAQALGIEPDEIGCAPYRPAVYSAGNPFHLVPVRNAEVLRRLTVNKLVWNAAFPHPRHSVYAFTEVPDEAGVDLGARMFGMNIGEDPGTGSAAAALIGLLADTDGLGSGQIDLHLRQGVEMGRPCRIAMQYKMQDEKLVHAAIGGSAIVIGKGTLELPE
jgi:trans-2,3-dihydro-3-hydroxyanthranilate isomerase